MRSPVNLACLECSEAVAREIQKQVRSAEGLDLIGKAREKEIEWTLKHIRRALEAATDDSLKLNFVHLFHEAGCVSGTDRLLADLHVAGEKSLAEIMQDAAQKKADAAAAKESAHNDARTRGVVLLTETNGLLERAFQVVVCQNCGASGIAGRVSGDLCPSCGLPMV